MSGCRRCSECINQEHHWMDWDPHEREDDEGNVVLGDVIVHCKHCEATKPWDPDDPYEDDEGDGEAEDIAGPPIPLDPSTLPLFKN